METRYTVRQAADMTGVKSYVLRYWEDELELRIRRNEMGHRYYTRYDIQLFLNIKELKNRGLQLRAIKDLLPKLSQTPPGSTESKIRLLDGTSQNAEKQPKQEEEAFDNDQELFTGHIEHEKILEFQAILERLIAQELQSKNAEEERCRSLDLAIRRQQLARKEAAASNEKRMKKEKIHKQKIHS